MPDLSMYPSSFFVGLVVWTIAASYGWTQRQKTFGLPLLAVLGTTFVWYFGDALYNDYSLYIDTISATALDAAWTQVSLFIIVVTTLAKPLSSHINAKFSSRSHVYSFFKRMTFSAPRFQARLDSLLRGMLAIWIVLMLIALYRVNFDVIGLFAPYLGQKADPWRRNRMGGGFDSLISLASYLQIFLTAGFLVIAALSTRSNTRGIALTISFLSLPYFLFDRTRNTMIATILPGFLAWVFLRVRGGLLIKLSIVLAAFFAISTWFAFVLHFRTHKSIAYAFATSDSIVETATKTKHLGLNMYEELGWINLFMERGTYVPNWGYRYFAEVVNPVPRVLWPEKPQIGIDYAIARGQAGGSAGSAGVWATISTGMIGQGVVNFGPWLGPLAAALLMSLWIALLARQDAQSLNPSRLLLYSVGLILTFNLGRDITLLVIYPFAFGIILVRFMELKELSSSNLKRRLSKGENSVPKMASRPGTR